MIVSLFVGKKCNEKALVVKKIFKFTNYRNEEKIMILRPVSR